LRELAARYLATIQGQASGTVALKTAIVERMLKEFRPGPDCQVGKIKPSDLSGWVARYGFGYSSYNHYVQVIHALFKIAVVDKVLVESPAKDLKGKKVVEPVRVTPSFEEFKIIIADVRRQKWNAEAQESADYLGPFVSALRAPVVQMMSYPPAREHGGHLVGRAGHFPWATAGREVDVATRVLVEKPGLVLVRHIVDRIIEVEVVVVHPVHRVAHVVNAGERVAALHAVGMLEEGVGRVIGTERGAVGGDRNARRLALGVDERKDFAGHIVVVLRL
jgi:hypothetical protein